MPLSDGLDDPATLMAHAAASGLDAVALTDHDAADGVGEAASAAARLGRPDAALAWAELTGEEADFRHALSLAAPDDATRLLDLADQLGTSATVLPLLRQAALAGDVEAMRQLAEDFEPDAVEAWAWVHLAQLCGTDLTRMEAIYEDGSPADDDLPGNIFAVGGIDVPDISAEQQALSRREAARRYEAIRVTER